MDELNKNAELQYVVFSLGNEEFGIDIMRVKEIKKLPRVTAIPNAAQYIEGVINLRGEVLPVIDLRTRFGLCRQEPTDDTRVIIVEMEQGKVGLVVDGVAEVLRTEANALQEPPRLAAIDTRFIDAVGNVDDRLLLILKLNELFTQAESEELQSVS